MNTLTLSIQTHKSVTAVKPFVYTMWTIYNYFNYNNVILVFVFTKSYLLFYTKQVLHMWYVLYTLTNKRTTALAQCEENLLKAWLENMLSMQ